MTAAIAHNRAGGREDHTSFPRRNARPRNLQKEESSMQATAGFEKNLHTGRGGRCWWIIVAVVALMLPLKRAGAENALSI
jgi:hypothetical protein